MNQRKSLNFWGSEVKSGQSLVVEPHNNIMHLSQACLDEVKKTKGSDSISLFVKSGEQKLVIGLLSAEKFPQLMLDVIFSKKFELSHNLKNGSVHFTGYYVPKRGSDGSDSEEDATYTLVDNGKPKVNTEKAKKTIKSVPKEVRIDDGFISVSDESDDEDFVGVQAMVMNAEDSSEDDDESDDDVDSEQETDDSEEEDEETPKKADVSKKRPAESTKTPANEKKTKFVTPEKTGADSKKGSVHIATPHPAKQAGKKPASSDQSKQQAPKSAGEFHCHPCNRSFNSDGALQSHTKAKHGAAK